MRDKDIFLDKDGAHKRTETDVYTVEGVEAQKHRYRLRLMWGYREFILAPGRGVDYVESFSAKPADYELLRADIIESLNRDETVDRVEDVNFDLQDRSLTIEVDVRDIEGELITVSGRTEV